MGADVVLMLMCLFVCTRLRGLHNPSVCLVISALNSQTVASINLSVQMVEIDSSLSICTPFKAKLDIYV
jgi:hypothetical protein